MRFRFGVFELDDRRFLLRCRGERVPLRPKVFDLLLHLLHHRDRVVLREELVATLWASTAVGAGALSGIVNELRRALGEVGQTTSSIRTVHARGYQFVAEIELVQGAEEVEGPSVSGGGSSGSAGSQATGTDPLTAWLDDFSRQASSGLLLEAASRERRAAFLDRLAVAAAGRGFEVLRPSAAAASVAEGSALEVLLESAVARWGYESVRARLGEHAAAEAGPSAADAAGSCPAVRCAVWRAREGTLGAMARMLRALAESAPLVLVLTPERSAATPRDLSALGALVDRLGDASVGLVVACDEALSIAPPTNGAAARFAHVSLDSAPIPALAELDRLLAARGIAALPGPLAEALWRHARGDLGSLESIAGWLGHVPRAAGEGAMPIGPDDRGPVELTPPRRMRRVDPYGRRQGAAAPGSAPTGAEGRGEASTWLGPNQRE